MFLLNFSPGFKLFHMIVDCVSNQTVILTFAPASGISLDSTAVMRPDVIEAVNIDNMTVPNKIQIMAIMRPTTVFGVKSPYLRIEK